MSNPRDGVINGPDTARPTILIVDDQPANLTVLSQLLSPKYQVRACKSGEQVLEVVRSDPRPDLILLDIMMPGMDGFGVLARLKKNKLTRDVPVILVTALGDEAAEETGFRLGAVDYVTKPLKPASVLARVGAHLEIKQDRDRLVREIEERKAAEQALQETQQMLQSVLNTIPVRVFCKDVDSNYLGCNRPFVLDAGLHSHEEIKGKNDFELAWAAQAELYRSDDRSVMETGIAKLGYEEPYTMPDGKRGWALTNKVPLLDAKGGIKGVLGTYEEITQHKQMEEALRESETKYRIVADNTYGWEYWIDPGGQFRYSSPSCERITGYSAGQMEKDPALFYRILHPDDLSRVRFHMEQVTNAHVRHEIEFRIIHRDGAIRWIGQVCQPVFSDEGTFLGVRGSNRDITKRKKAEEALGRQRKVLQRIIDKAHTHLVYLDPDFNFVAVNATYAQTCQRTPEELIGKNHFLFYPHAENEAIFRQVRQTGEAVSFRDKPFVFPDQPGRGTTFWDWTLTPVKDESGSVEGLVFSLVETTERKRTEDALRESQAWLSLALRSARMGAWYWDLVENRRYFDEPVCHLLGIDPTTLTQTLDEFFSAVHPEDHEKIRLALAQAIERDVPYQLVHRVIWPDGSVHHISSRGSLLRDSQGRPLRLNGLSWDVTEQNRAEEERKQFEDRLQHAKKAESLGRMAAAIAHNFNNLFSVVLGRLELVIEDLAEGSEPARNIAEAVVALGRAAKISRLMLAYLGQSVGKKEPIDLSDTCREALALLISSLPVKVHLKLELEEEKAIVLADSVQITEVLSNLMVNAGEAMGGRQGDVALAIRIIQAADISAGRFYPLEWEPKAEKYACLSVSDTGIGMDDETIEKAFDPFFSTKFLGKGLGLAAVLGIVKAHQGALTVESVPDCGTVFRVFLPLSEEELQLPMQPEPAKAASPKVRRVVLLVDDEPMIRSLVSVKLERLGYEVITAVDGVEALEKFREHEDRIQCVVLDLLMPRMDGWETLAALRTLRPGLPIILSSGYDESRAIQSHHQEHPQVFLAKPYKSKDLQAALEKALVATT